MKTRDEMKRPDEKLTRNQALVFDCLSGSEMAAGASRAGAFGPEVVFEYIEQPRWLFEALRGFHASRAPPSTE